MIQIFTTQLVKKNMLYTSKQLQYKYELFIAFIHSSIVFGGINRRFIVWSFQPVFEIAIKFINQICPFYKKISKLFTLIQCPHNSL